MKLEVGNKLKTVFAKTKLGFKKHSAEILIAGGVTGVVVSAVLACVATTKVGKHVNDAKEKIKVIHKERTRKRAYLCIFENWRKNYRIICTCYYSRWLVLNKHHRIE